MEGEEQKRKERGGRRREGAGVKRREERGKRRKEERREGEKERKGGEKRKADSAIGANFFITTFLTTSSLGVDHDVIHTYPTPPTSFFLLSITSTLFVQISISLRKDSFRQEEERDATVARQGRPMDESKQAVERFFLVLRWEKKFWYDCQKWQAGVHLCLMCGVFCMYGD